MLTPSEPSRADTCRARYTVSIVSIANVRLSIRAVLDSVSNKKDLLELFRCSLAAPVTAVALQVLTVFSFAVPVIQCKGQQRIFEMHLACTTSPQRRLYP